MNYLESLRQKGYKVDNLSDLHKEYLSKINRQTQLLKSAQDDEEYSESQIEKFQKNLDTSKQLFEKAIGLEVVVVPDGDSTKLENTTKKSNGIFGFLAVIGVGALAALFIASGTKPLDKK